MNTEIKGVHVEVSDKMRAYIDKKSQRLKYASDYIVDLLFTISLEKRKYKLDVNINFRWGNSIHVGVSDFDIFKGIDELMDKMERKINKEKEKVQEHKGQDTVRNGEAVLEES